jgi:hypothetical protein
MAWQDQLRGDPLPWLLEAESPGARYLALRDLLDRGPDDPELGAAREAAHTTGPIAAVLAEMDEMGFWAEPGPGYLPKYRSTVWSIILLAQLGALAGQDERIARACGYLIDQALAPGGQFASSSAPSGTVDCLQGNLCAALVDLGYDDPRLAAAFDWMARTVTGEGIAPMEERHAAVRYYAGKCGPTFACGANNKLPCAWGARLQQVACGPPDAYYRQGHRARGRFPVQHRPGQGRLSVWLERQAERELVEVRLSGVLRHRPAADRRGLGWIGLWRRSAAGECAGGDPGQARRAGQVAAGI